MLKAQGRYLENGTLISIAQVCKYVSMHIYVVCKCCKYAHICSFRKYTF